MENINIFRSLWFLVVFVGLASCAVQKCVTREELQHLVQELVHERLEKLETRLSALETNESFKKLASRNGNNMHQTIEATIVQNQINDTTLEERVTILEFQVANIQNDITQINGDISTVNGDVTTLTDDVNTLEDEVRDLDEDLEDQLLVIAGEQVQQDERLFTIEQNEEALFATVTGLKATDASLNSTMDSVNDKVSILAGSLTGVAGRVRVLENETSIFENNVNNNLEDVDERLARLELSGTIAFQADLNEYTSIPEGSVVIFNVVDLNIGNGYNNGNGKFTVPNGGAGLYFLYVNFFADDAKITNFIIRVNGNQLCFARADQNGGNGGDNGNPSCGAVTTLSDGDVVDVLYNGEAGNFPLNSDGRPYNTFSGFRIAPE